MDRWIKKIGYFVSGLAIFIMMPAIFATPVTFFGEDSSATIPIANPSNANAARNSFLMPGHPVAIGGMA